MAINLSESEWCCKATPEVPCRTQGFSQVMSDCTKPTVLNRAVMVLQKVIIAVLMIAQLIYASIKDRAGSMGMRKTEQTINVAAAAVERTEQAVNVAAAADEQPGQETMVAAATMTDEAAAEAAAATDAASSAAAASDQREQTRSGAAAAAGVRREQTKKQKNWTSRQTKQAGQAASGAAAASDQREQTRSGAATAAGVRREQTDKQKECTSSLTKQAGQVASVAAAASIQQDEAGQPASRVPAAIQRNTRSRWPVAITTVVIFMMMSATAGAAEHGLAQQMTTSQQLEWVSKLGEIQQTIDQLGELKRRNGWVQHTEAAEAQRIRTDRAEATLQILGELNHNMRSEIEKQGARVDLGRQIQFMHRLLNAEQQKEQPAHVMRQDIPEDSGHKQQHGQKDLNCGEEQTKGRQTSRRLKLLMRRLCEDERQREGAERELRNLKAQVQDYKQERGEHDAVQQSEKTPRSPTKGRSRYGRNGLMSNVL